MYAALKLASAATVAALAAVSAAAWSRLPAGTMLPTHWGLDGQPDRYADAGVALFAPVGLAALIGIGMAALPRLEPMQDRLTQSASLYRTTWAVTLAIAAMVEAMVAAPAFGRTLPGTLVLAGVGAAMIVVGNALPKSRPGFFIGVRTPWTLIDRETWIATHRLAAWAWIGAGMVMIAAAADAPWRLPMLGLAIVLALLPVPYSWWHWRARVAG